MNSCAIYCTSRLQFNFTTVLQRTRKKELFRLLSYILSWLNRNLLQHYSAQYTTMDDSDEQLRHLLYFKTSSQHSQLCGEGNAKKNISPPPPQLIDLALAQMHLELAEPQPGAALQCTVHYSTVHDSDEQLRHLLYFKTSSQLHNCATKDDHVCKCKKHDVA